MLQRERIVRIEGIAGKARCGREMRGPVDPSAIRRIARCGNVRIRHEEIIPVAAGPLFVSFQFFVALAQQHECVVIAAEPDMEPVLLDATGGPAAGGSFAAKPPAELIDGDVVGALVLRPGQFEGCRDRRATAPDHRDLDWLSVAQLPLPLARAASHCVANPSNHLDQCYMLLHDKGKWVGAGGKIGDAGRTAAGVVRKVFSAYSVGCCRSNVRCRSEVRCPGLPRLLCCKGVTKANTAR